MNSKYKAFKYLDEMFNVMSDLPETDEEVKQLALDFLEDEFGEDFFNKSLIDITEDWMARR